MNTRQLCPERQQRPVASFVVPVQHLHNVMTLLGVLYT